MSGHTLGPWHARMQKAKDGKPLGLIIEHDEGRIGWAYLAFNEPNVGTPHDAPENVANANLIAAAPDMLEALRDLLSCVKAAIDSGDWVVDGACDPDAAINRAEIAIEKATT